MKAINDWLNKATKPTTKENTFKPYICVQSSVNEGDGLSFNEKAEHIFKQLKNRK